MAHIIINRSLSATIAYNLFFNPPKFAKVSAILEPENSKQTDYSIQNVYIILWTHGGLAVAPSNFP